jgi:hypothetical protein
VSPVAPPRRAAAPADPGLDTPVAPLPPPSPPTKGRRTLLGPAGAGLGFALRAWRPLLCVLAIQLVLGLAVVAPFHARMSARLDAHGHAPALAGRPDAFDQVLGFEGGLHPGVWTDAKRLEEPLFEGLSVALFFVVTVAWLFGALAAGGFLGIAASGGPAKASRFFHEGGRWFPRMLRVGLCFGVLYLLLGRVVFELWGLSVADAEKASPSEASNWRAARLREGTFVLLFLWLRVVGDLARADLVVFARRSALLAFLRAFGRTLRHPLRTLLPALLLGAPAFALLLGLGTAMNALGAGPDWTLWAQLGVIQAAVLVRWASRAAVLAADVEIVRVRP